MFAQRLPVQLRPPEHFIRVAANAVPAERLNRVDHIAGSGAVRGQVSAVNHEIGPNRLQISDDGVEGRQVAVNVRNDSDSHGIRESDTLRGFTIRCEPVRAEGPDSDAQLGQPDRKSTRLNSSHVSEY